MKMNSCYPNSSLPVDYWHQSIISLHMHHAYLNIAQNIRVLFYSNPPGGGENNFLILCGSVNAMIRLTELFTFRRILCRQLLQHFLRLHLAHFPVVFYFTYFDFFSDIKWVQYRAFHNGLLAHWVNMNF